MNQFSTLIYDNLGSIVATVIGGIILAVILRFFGKIKVLLRKFLHFFTRYRPRIPKETVRILPRIHSMWWAMGKESGKPAMQVVGDWYVTNITHNNVRLLGARIGRPKTDGMVMVRHPQNNIYGNYPILLGATTDIRADFWIWPPVRKEGEDFKTTMILIDQYGNEHHVKNVVFKGPKPKEPEKQENSGEAMHAIKDPIEKEVVPVLKAELNTGMEKQVMQLKVAIKTFG